MSLTSSLNQGLAALTAALPPEPYAAGGITAAVAGVVIAAGWTASRPTPTLTAATLPSLTPGGPMYREPASPSPAAAAAEPLTVPLETIPRDDRGRTPYDLVGTAALRTAVDQFYSRLCSDPELFEFFHQIDMERLKRHQAAFLAQLWGGPVHMPLERLAELHQPLAISADRYWRVAGHLMATLTHLDVPDWICVFTMTRLYQAQNLIVEQVAAAEPGDPAAVQPPDAPATVQP